MVQFDKGILISHYILVRLWSNLKPQLPPETFRHAMESKDLPFQINLFPQVGGALMFRQRRQLVIYVMLTKHHNELSVSSKLEIF
jgi:hypothetical protein